MQGLAGPHPHGPGASSRGARGRIAAAQSGPFQPDSPHPRTWREALLGSYSAAPAAPSHTPPHPLPSHSATHLRRSSRALCWRLPGSAPVDLQTRPTHGATHLGAAAHPPHTRSRRALALPARVSPGPFPCASIPLLRSSRSHQKDGT